MTARTIHPEATITVHDMAQRLAELKEARRTHARRTEAAPGMPGTYTTSNSEAAFFTLDALTYYEKLTGHIEELNLLIQLAEITSKKG